MNKEYEEAKEFLKKEKEIIAEIEKTTSLFESTKSISEKNLLSSQLESLDIKFKQTNQDLKRRLERIQSTKALNPELLIRKENKDDEEAEKDAQRKKMSSPAGKTFTSSQISAKGLEKETINRIRKGIKDKEKEEKKSKNKKTSQYTKISSEYFSKFSLKLLSQESFSKMEEQLIKANLNFTPTGYISIILMTTLISAFVAGFLFLFFLFFNVGAAFPIIQRAADPINIRFIKTFWMLFFIPAATFFFMYAYPSMEKKSAESKINAELPFATINMAAISGSMVNPIKIFEILISTNEYPALKREFVKLINEINLYGYDLVSALKNTSKNSPSKSLAELLNGLATTINSGGDLKNFFDERANTLLFNYRIYQEGQSKVAETSMDIYISMLIAAPMILMLLLIIMKISGLGITMSFMAISFMIILVVTVVNILFISFLNMKKQQ